MKGLNHAVGEKKLFFTKNYGAGFTLTELCVVMAVIGILAAFAVPGYFSQIENIRLRRAAKDLYSNMQRVKMDAIKDNTSHRIIFNAIKGQESYEVWSEGPNRQWDKQSKDDVLKETIQLSDYGEGITFGKGNAQYDATKDKGNIPEDGISYQDSQIRFHPIGTIGIYGYVYLCNHEGVNYAVGTPYLAGLIKMRKWKGNKWD